MIEFNNVTKNYGSNIGLSDINIRIDDGEFVFIVGPSGAGKSTFIKLMLKEVDPDEGTITIDEFPVTSLSNRMIPYYRRRIGVVFQDFRLLPKMTVYENVAFAMEVVHQNKREIRKQVRRILQMMGIADKAEMYPDELSGGEQQRVAIARAIVNEPTVLIADEPTGNLDPEKSWEIMNLLDEINQQGTTVVMVTHAQDIVDQMGKRVIQIEDGHLVRDDESGLYIKKNRYRKQRRTEEEMLEDSVRERRYQDRLRNLGVRKASRHARQDGRMSADEVLRQAAEIERAGEREGGADYYE